MKPAQAESLEVLPGDNAVPLESILCTEELNLRPSRPPDYETENRTLVGLVKALADPPGTILQQMAEAMLGTFRAGSSGFSLLTKEDDGKNFYWPAISGLWKSHIGGGTPRDFGPSGDVLDCNAPLLFRRPERRYTYFQAVTPPIEECLLVPFYSEGKAVGTIWIIAHDKKRKFDAEDLRQLVSVGRFASSAYQVTGFQAKAATMNEALILGSLRQHELAEAAENLNEQLKVEVIARQKVVQELAEKARLIDLSNDAIIVRDLDDKIRLWNKGAEKLFGWTFMEVVGKDLHSLLQTEFPMPIEEIIAELHRG
ncbi:MAG: PAS domain-containing protein, partial [Armatimonadetes bacterium]|nr:PAS domain-containing protein [Akkermansiaceae bacterium]